MKVEDEYKLDTKADDKVINIIKKIKTKVQTKDGDLLKVKMRQKTNSSKKLMLHYFTNSQWAKYFNEKTINLLID